MKIERLRALFYYKDGNLYNKISRGSAKKDMVAGYIAEDGYRRVRVDGVYLYIHRIAWILYTNKEIPEDLFIDHIDGNRLNNDINNLRLASSLENQYNKFRQKNGTSIYKGVWFDAKKNFWKASIRLKDKRLYIGQFDTELEAAIAYDKIAIELQGRFAKLNVLTRLPNAQPEQIESF
jgi:hypothetical protein